MTCRPTLHGRASGAATYSVAESDDASTTETKENEVNRHRDPER